MKNQKGITMSDVTITTVILLVFTATIASFSYNAYYANLKAQRTGMAGIVLTQALEIIAYDELMPYSGVQTISQEVEYLDLLDSIQIGGIATIKDVFCDADSNYAQYMKGYKIKLNVEEKKDSPEDKGIKKINLTVKYNVGKKQYECSANRIIAEP